MPRTTQPLRLAAMALALSLALPATAEEPRTPGGLVLAVSGGISLGSYEAGVNWAIVRAIKRSRRGRAPIPLVAATGASAGSANAFLSAVTYCQDDEADAAETTEKNLFFRAWIPVGWARLFPEETTCAAYARRFPSAKLTCADERESVFAPDDGVFTRKALRETEDALAGHAGRVGTFRPGCSVDVGVTLTKSTPSTIRAPTLDLEVETQRYAVLLRGGTRPDGSFAFHDPGGLSVYDDANGRGAVLHLPRDASSQVRMTDVLSVLEASAAFPIAFGPKVLQYCPEDAGGPVDGPGFSCARVSASERFLDGGVFDNLPLGLAMQLRSTRTPPPDGLLFLSVDPEARRPVAPTPPEVREGGGLGLAFLFDLAGGLVGVARQYELQLVARLLEENPSLAEGRRFRLSSRFFPIFSEHLGAFAGFLAQPFREHDFRVGVYDGLWQVARLDCEGTPRGPERASCEAEALVELEAAIVGADRDTSFVVRRLFLLELAATLERGELQSVLSRELPNGGSIRAWAEGVQSTSSLLPLLLEVGTELDRRLRPGLHGRPDAPWRATATEQFDWVLRRLREGGAGKYLGADARLVDDPDSLSRETFVRLARRLLTVEQADADPTLEPVREVWEFALRTDELLRHEGFDPVPSSIPDDEPHVLEIAFQLLPEHFARDWVRESWELGWRPTWGLAPELAITLPARIGFDDDVERVWVRTGPGLLFRPPGSVGIVLSGLELTPYLGADLPSKAEWRVRDDMFAGGELAGYLLGGKLRLSAGAFTYGETVTPTFTAGLADVNGLLYWIGRWAL